MSVFRSRIGSAAAAVIVAGLAACGEPTTIDCQIPQPDCDSAIEQAFDVMGSYRPSGAYRVVPLCSPESCTPREAARAWVLYPEGTAAVEVCPDRSCEAKSIPLLPRLIPDDEQTP